MTTVRGAVATQQAQQQNRPSVAQMIATLQPEIQRALPAGLNADRMARLALTAIRKNPDLAECSPASFAGALLTASALGLEPEVNGEAYLVPYKNHGKLECQLIIGYAGMAKLYFQHPLAQHLDAQAVFEADEFDYAYGLDPYLTHKPARGDRGVVTFFYAVARLTTGAKAFVVLSPEEVKTLRGGRVGPTGNIPDPQMWMERKTALRQLVKLLPKSTQLNRALAVDEHGGRELHADLVAQRGQIEGRVVPPVAEGPPDDPPESGSSSPASGAGGITGPQSAKMHALLYELGMGERVAGLAYISDQLNRQVESSADLSKAEAMQVISSLEEVNEHPFQQEPPQEET